MRGSGGYVGDDGVPRDDNFQGYGVSTTDAEGRTLAYDAWNRLVSVKNAAGQWLLVKFDVEQRTGAEHDDVERCRHFKARRDEGCARTQNLV